MFLFIIPVSPPAESSRVIMVITKVTHVIEPIGINLSAPFAVVVSDVGHVFLVEKSVSNPEEEGIVKDCIKRA